MHITKLNNNILNNRQTDKFDYMIYKHFEHLVEQPKLMHSYEKIKELLDSKDTQIYLLMKKTSIYGYVVCSKMSLTDGRKVLFINYIFTSPQHRHNGYGNILLNYIMKYAKSSNVDGIMLICNTTDKKIHDWYARHGFMLDFHLRRYEKYDVMYKSA